MHIYDLQFTFCFQFLMNITETLKIPCMFITITEYSNIWVCINIIKNMLNGDVHNLLFMQQRIKMTIVLWRFQIQDAALTYGIASRFKAKTI